MFALLWVACGFCLLCCVYLCYLGLFVCLMAICGFALLVFTTYNVLLVYCLWLLLVVACYLLLDFCCLVQLLRLLDLTCSLLGFFCYRDFVDFNWRIAPVCVYCVKCFACLLICLFVFRCYVCVLLVIMLLDLAIIWFALHDFAVGFAGLCVCLVLDAVVLCNLGCLFQVELVDVVQLVILRWFCFVTCFTALILCI